MIRWGLAVALWLSLVMPGSAEEPPQSWLYRAWQTEDGLPNNDVTCIAQAADGAMLFATRGGLARFDGWRFREIGVDAPGYRGGAVSAVLLTRDGTRWIVSRGAIARQRAGEADLALKLPVAGRASRETAFFEDREGVVWLCYEGGRLLRVKDGRVQQAPVAQPLASAFASCAALDSNGDVWAVGSRVIARWRDGRFEKVAELSDERATLARAAAGGLWIGDGMQLLRYTEREGLRVVGELPNLPDSKIATMHEDRHGRLWLGTFNGGLWLRERDSFQQIALSQPDVWWLCEDHEGNIWAATAGGGACRIRPRVLAKLDDPGSPRGETARALCRDARGDIWVATQTSRLFARRRGAWQLFTPQQDWPGTQAMRVNARVGGSAWIANDEGKIARWNGSAFESVALPPDPGNRPVFSFLETRAGDLWVGRGARVWHRRGDEWKAARMPGGGGSALVLAEDSSGRIWAGTSSGLLLREEDGTFVREAAEELGPACNGIRALLVAPDGSLLIATQGAGIARLAGGHCRTITREHGLPHNVVSQLALDGEGRLWAGGDAGIFVVPLNELVAVAENRASRVLSTLFGKTEGLSGMQANASFPGVLTDGDGRLWFSTRSGIVIADPRMVGINTAPPPVAIEEMRVGDHTIPLSGPIAIGPGAANIQFTIAAMSYAAPEHTRIVQRLDGLDADWKATSSDRTATFSHLQPGDYTLRVRATNNDGIWSAKDATLAFTVRPFFWQTVWFQVVVVAAAVVAAILGTLLANERRLRRQAEQHRRETEIERERTRIARDMHDQVGASLTQIGLLAELARRDAHAPEEHLTHLAETTRAAVTALDEIVWAVNPRHDNLASLLEYLGQQARDLLTAAGIRCRLNFPDTVPPLHLTAEFRHHLFLLVREAVNNAVKYAAAREVRISVEFTPADLRAIITDDGRGFTAEAASAVSEGLRNMQARAAALGGECSIQSQAGVGTTVSFRLPWPSSSSSPVS